MGTPVRGHDIKMKREVGIVKNSDFLLTCVYIAAAIQNQGRENGTCKGAGLCEFRLFSAAWGTSFPRTPGITVKREIYGGFIDNRAVLSYNFLVTNRKPQKKGIA